MPAQLRRRTPRSRAPGLRLILQRLRGKQEGPVLHRRHGGQPHKPLRRHQEERRAAGACLQQALRHSLHGTALLHRLRTLRQARHGVLQLHRQAGQGREHQDIQLRQLPQGLHIHRRHRGGRGQGHAPRSGETHRGGRPPRAAVHGLQHRQQLPGEPAGLRDGASGGACQGRGASGGLRLRGPQGACPDAARGRARDVRRHRPAGARLRLQTSYPSPDRAQKLRAVV